jgi:hypothetical protein
VDYWEGYQLLCQSNYEKFVIEKYINIQKYHIDWQIKFDIPTGKVYFCDMYIKELDRYVEIKGYMRPHSKLKWEWFHKEYPNSELWDKEKLKQLGILK